MPKSGNSESLYNELGTNDSDLTASVAPVEWFLIVIANDCGPSICHSNIAVYRVVSVGDNPDGASALAADPPILLIY